MSKKIILQDLIKLWWNEKYDIQLLECIVDLFHVLPDFSDFLESQWYSSYELAFPTFGFIIDYLDYLYLEWNLIAIHKIIWYLEWMRLSHNEYEQNLLFVWVLENFDRLQCLSDIILIMPDWLRKDFIESFPQYVWK